MTEKRDLSHLTAEPGGLLMLPDGGARYAGERFWKERA